MKIKVIHKTRFGMGYEYDEKYYCCPKCGKEIMYDNDVVIVRGKKQNYCDECGEYLEWNDE